MLYVVLSHQSTVIRNPNECFGPDMLRACAKRGRVILFHKHHIGDFISIVSRLLPSLWSCICIFLLLFILLTYIYLIVFCIAVTSYIPYIYILPYFVLYLAIYTIYNHGNSKNRECIKLLIYMLFINCTWINVIIW